MSELPTDAELNAIGVLKRRLIEARALGVPELGAVFSCQRDGALMAGFNPDVEFTRTQTIMAGASHCDFVYQLRRVPREE